MASNLARTVTASINYFTPPEDGSLPWSKADRNSSTGEEYTNWKRDPRNVNIRDVRGEENHYTLDTAGFSFHTGKTTLSANEFDDEERVKSLYWKESENLLKEITGARKVVVFDHTIRRNRPDQFDSGATSRKPVFQAHGDQTVWAAQRRVRWHLPAEAEHIIESRSRFQIINLWRPIRVPAIEHPLALCDFRSVVPTEDLYTHKLIFANYDGEILAIKHSERHQWRYWRGMTPDEFIVFKCFDTDNSVATMTPHSAFVDPTTPDNAAHRESIELRAIVLY